MSHFCRDSAGHHFLKVLRKGGRMDSTRKGNPNVVVTTRGHVPATQSARASFQSNSGTFIAGTSRPDRTRADIPAQRLPAYPGGLCPLDAKG
jgi:hypothetical protein